MHRWPLVACGFAAAVVLFSGSPMHAQEGSRWRFSVGAGGVSSSTATGEFLGGLGSAVTGSASFAVAPRLRVQAEGLWAVEPGRAVGAPRQVSIDNCPPSVACACNAIASCLVSYPVHGSAGIAGLGAALVVDGPSFHGLGSYVLAGTGAYRDYTVPHVDSAWVRWRAGPVLTTGAVTLGYGVRVGAAQRYGFEVRAQRFSAGLARWLFPATLTLRL